MVEYNSNMDAFDRICGDCAGVDILHMTNQDVRDQAHAWCASGEPCSDEMVEAAILGLAEYQKNHRQSL